MCQCYQIDGPFIAEDPDCPLHGAGGANDQIADLERQVAHLQRRIEQLESQLRNKDAQ